MEWAPVGSQSPVPICTQAGAMLDTVAPPLAIGGAEFLRGIMEKT